MVVDTKDKESGVTEADIKKLIQDAEERSIAVGIIVAKDVSQLRQILIAIADGDRRTVFGCYVPPASGSLVDLEVLKPLLERMRTEGPDFLQRNAALAEELLHLRREYHR